MSKVKHLRPSIRPWNRVKTEIVAEYRVFEIERHAIVDGDGKPRMDVNTFRFPDWCNVIAITPEQELVLVWQYRFGTGTMSLELPGGCVDPGEEPLVAAGRELAEEAGYALGPTGLTHLTTFVHDDADVRTKGARQRGTCELRVPPSSPPRRRLRGFPSVLWRFALGGLLRPYPPFVGRWFVAAVVGCGALRGG